MCILGGRALYTVSVGGLEIPVETDEPSMVMSREAMMVVLVAARNEMNAYPYFEEGGDAVMKALSRKALFGGYRRRIKFTGNPPRVNGSLVAGYAPPNRDVTIYASQNYNDVGLLHRARLIAHELVHVYSEVVIGIVADDSHSRPADLWGKYGLEKLVIDTVVEETRSFFCKSPVWNELHGFEYVHVYVDGSK